MTLDPLHHQLAEALRVAVPDPFMNGRHGAKAALAVYDAAKKECPGIREHMAATKDLNVGVYDAAKSAPAEPIDAAKNDPTEKPTDARKWAEGLIRLLPHYHDGRNSWLLNHGTGVDVEAMRDAHPTYRTWDAAKAAPVEPATHDYKNDALYAPAVADDNTQLHDRLEAAEKERDLSHRTVIAAVDANQIVCKERDLLRLRVAELGAQVGRVTTERDALKAENAMLRQEMLRENEVALAMAYISAGELFKSKLKNAEAENAKLRSGIENLNGPGSAVMRFKLLLDMLEQRFPPSSAETLNSGVMPEACVIQKLDATISELAKLRERAERAEKRLEAMTSDLVVLVANAEHNRRVYYGSMGPDGVSLAACMRSALAAARQKVMEI